MDFNLNKSLDKIIKKFADECQNLFTGPDINKPATKNDLLELSKRITYALDEFKSEIVKKF